MNLKEELERVAKLPALDMREAPFFAGVQAGKIVQAQCLLDEYFKPCEWRRELYPLCRPSCPESRAKTICKQDDYSFCPFCGREIKEVSE